MDNVKIGEIEIMKLDLKAGDILVLQLKELISVQKVEEMVDMLKLELERVYKRRVPVMVVAPDIELKVLRKSDPALLGKSISHCCGFPIIQEENCGYLNFICASCGKVVADK